MQSLISTRQGVDKRDGKFLGVRIKFMLVVVARVAGTEW